jgi:hypothetical protein
MTHEFKSHMRYAECDSISSSLHNRYCSKSSLHNSAIWLAAKSCSEKFFYFAPSNVPPKVDHNVIAIERPSLVFIKPWPTLLLVTIKRFRHCHRINQTIIRAIVLGWTKLVLWKYSPCKGVLVFPATYTFPNQIVLVFLAVLEKKTRLGRPTLRTTQDPVSGLRQGWHLVSR